MYRLDEISLAESMYRLDELSLAESMDQGKPVWLAKQMDIPRASHNFRSFAESWQV